MTIIPVIRCRGLRESVAFYTIILDFERIDGATDLTDPSFCVVIHDGHRIFLSSHSGDARFGQALVIITEDIEAVCRKLRTCGLLTPGDFNAPREVHDGSILQSWGTREFYVDDLNGNTIRFVQKQA